MSKKAYVVTQQHDSSEGLQIVDCAVFLSESTAKTYAEEAISSYLEENEDEEKFELNEDAEDSPILYQASNEDNSFVVLVMPREIQE